MEITEDNYLAHYGILRRSGRYKWGSGDGPKEELSGGFLNAVKELKGRGLTDTEISKGFGITTTDLRALQSIEVNRIKHEKIMTAEKLAAKGMGASAIAKQMGLPNESSVRSLLAPGQKEKADNLQTIANVLRKNVDEKGFIDVGSGVDARMNISETKLKTAIAVLREEGYVVHPTQVPNAGGGKNLTTVKVMAKPGTTYRDVKMNQDKIRQIGEYSKDGGRTFDEPKPPLNISPKRVKVIYAEDGGSEADGLIYVRPGVKDVTLGGSKYAQVRIAVGGTHYLKGMAVYKDDLPDGIDLAFNTNKSNTGNKLDAMKKQALRPDGTVDVDNPFGAQLRRQILDPKGEKTISAMNILDEEGTWGNWSKSISTQVLSKQSPKLAQQQLDLTYQRKRDQLEEIKALTNPAVRRLLLEKFADGADSSAVHLKAAHLPGQGTHVILPIRSLKDTEVYAPNYKNGDVVALVRYPHGGKFEIPELKVNNNNREAIDALGKQAPDAIGINHRVASRLSGADFDGDTVVVFSNNKRQIQSEPALKALKDFDPQKEYRAYDGMKTIDGGTYNAKTKTVEFPPGKSSNGRRKGTEMGYVSNLITDMTIKGAGPDELARAVKHSMVVIDAEKHSLDFKKSYQDQGIRSLYTKYQDKAQGGASTLISRATSSKTVVDMKPRSAKDGGPIDPKTGKRMLVPRESYVDRNGQTRYKMTKVAKLADTDDARTLISTKNTVIENVYANHSNRLKAIANEARIEVAAFKPPKMNPAAAKVYKSDVNSLLLKLNEARKNKPLERQAQLFAQAVVADKIAKNPTMDPADLKKIRQNALATARARTGASKSKIVPTPSEWAAIQAGAVSQSRLKQILDNSDLDAIRELATPRITTVMTSTKLTRARSMAASGYTQDEIADALGVSVSTVKDGLSS